MLLVFLGGFLVGGLAVGGLVLWICTVARGPALVHITDRDRTTTERYVPYPVDAAAGHRPCAPAARVCGCSTAHVPATPPRAALDPASIRDGGATR